MKPLGAYIIEFCRFVIFFTFSYSFFGKARNPKVFEFTVKQFRILPNTLVKTASVIVILSEITIVFLVGIGSSLLSTGFIFSIVNLLIFSGALVSALVRNIAAPCNCFGRDNQKISLFDLGRNMGFISVAILGLALISSNRIFWGQISFVESGLIAVMATVFVIIWTQLRVYFAPLQ